ncbi:hypothetical protein VPH35_110231 [Triticum aestivum]
METTRPPPQRSPIPNPTNPSTFHGEPVDPPMAGTKRGGRKAVAGDDKRSPPKRKAASSGDEAGACEASPPTLDVAMLRKRLLEDLQAFPEAAVLEEHQLKEAVDRLIKESKPETATPTAKGMVRFGDDQISMAFSHGNWLGFPTTEDFPPTGEVLPGWLDERRRQLDLEVQPEKREEPDNMRLLLAKIRVDLLTKGYVELPELYLDYTPPKVVARSPPKHIPTAVASG